MFAQVFGQMNPDPIGTMLNTGYHRFAAGGVDGLARVEGSRADILALNARNPGTGQVRALIKNCQKIYAEIYMWEVWNSALAAALARYGFTETTEIQDGEESTGYKWASSKDSGAQDDHAPHAGEKDQ